MAESNAADTTAYAPARSAIQDLIDRIISAVRFRQSRLGAEARMFARCLEESVFPEKQETGAHEVILRVDDVDSSIYLTTRGRPEQEACHQLPKVSRFLSRCGIRRIVLDTELECNQITDILQTLWLLRSFLKRDRVGIVSRVLGRRRIHRALTSADGLHMACAEVRLDSRDGVLIVRNSYCQLLFSRAISAYKSSRRQFKDHRAFFRMAPRFALAAAFATMLPAVLYLLFDAPPNLMAALSFVLAALAGFGTYIVFLTIASEEYDKEHQSKELERRHRSLSAVVDRISRDLQTARDIQRQILPEPSTQVMPDRVHLAASFVPEMEVGGDYYDFRRLDDDRIALLIADVSGHGMSAAFITGLIKSAFEYSKHAAQNPVPFVEELNDVLCRLTPDESFAAVVFAIYDARRRTLIWCNAGHGPVPIVVRGIDGGIEEMDEPVDLLAGVDTDATYRQGTLDMLPGDKLLVFTDGVPDSVNAEGERLGMDPLRALLHEHAEENAEAIRDAVIALIREHTREAPQFDDITLVAMEVLA